MREVDPITLLYLGEDFVVALGADPDPNECTVLAEVRKRLKQNPLTRIIGYAFKDGNDGYANLMQALREQLDMRIRKVTWGDIRNVLDRRGEDIVLVLLNIGVLPIREKAKVIDHVKMLKIECIK
jgi:hypothetical protein